MIDLKNWAGNYRYTAQAIHRPRTVEDVQSLVRHASKLRVLGTRHSFNDIADSSGALISLEHLNRIDEPDRQRMTVTLDGGVCYGELCQFLHERGVALPNTASLMQVNVAGACATGTHG